MADTGDRPDAERRRLVGPGRLLRPAEDLRTAREDTIRHGQNFLVVGPWNHGGWSGGDGRKLGRIDFGSATSAYYRQNVLTPFLAHYLKGTGKAPVSEALTFRTGTNEWVQHDAWPPRRDVTDRRLYLQAERRLSFDPPPASAAPAFDSYVSDPANPVPYRPTADPLECRMDHVARRGSALRPPAAGRARLGERAAREAISRSRARSSPTSSRRRAAPTATGSSS